MIKIKYVFEIQTIKHLNALQCRLNRKVNIAQVIKKLKYRNNIREFSNYENRHVKNNAKSCCFDGAI